MRFSLFKKSRRGVEIDPDEIFLDSRNLPDFDQSQMEGRLEKPIGKHVRVIFVGVLSLIALVYIGRLGVLQVVRGEEYKTRSEQNRLEETVVFTRRGVVYDRTGVELAWNVEQASSTFATRAYTGSAGFGHVLGYVTLPKKDSSGRFYKTDTEGVAGIERAFNERLRGENGKRIVEVDALGTVHSESVQMLPKDGENITLSIDAGVQHALYGYIKELADRVPFVGGAGAIMDVETGELLALTSYPEYDSRVMTEGKDRATIQSYNTDNRKPFLDRFISGLYTPGSIVKPFMAIAALIEGVITPEKQIYSAGYMLVPNPYNPDKPSRFNDWKAHGNVDMRRALAVSSDVYFYQIGGGFKDQPGIGIANIEKYARLFGMATKTGITLAGEEGGTIPNPEWKEKVFEGEPWRVGDTYNTVIGQYGFQVTPIQMLRAVASIANKGTLLTPSLEASTTPRGEKVNIPGVDFTVAGEGMRLAVTEGTTMGLSKPGVQVAAKTGTAQVGVANQYMNSWVMGYFPYEKPRYAFVVIMERAPAKNTTGGVYVMRQLLDWMELHTPQYLTETP